MELNNFLYVRHIIYNQEKYTDEIIQYFTKIETRNFLWFLFFFCYFMRISGWTSCMLGKHSTTDPLAWNSQILES